MPSSSNLIHNERVKLRASTTATIGTAFIITGLVAPLVTGSISFSWSILLNVLWIVIGVGLRMRALRILGELRE